APVVPEARTGGKPVGRPAPEAAPARRPDAGSQVAPGERPTVNPLRALAPDKLADFLRCLLGFLGTGPRELRQNTRRVLVALGREAVPTLLEGLHSDHPQTRQGAAAVLVESGMYLLAVMALNQELNSSDR